MHERVLVINSTKKQCGAYQYLLRVFDALRSDSRFEYADIGSEEEFRRMDTSVYSHIIINYHTLLFPWWNTSLHKRVYYIYHEGPVAMPISHEFIIDSDPTQYNGIPRPLFKTKHIPTFTPNKIPVIGTFGFGLYQKRFDLILRIVQEQFDEAHIRILMPFCDHSPEDQGHSQTIFFANTLRPLIYKSGVKLEIIHDFLDDEQLQAFLSSNDINIFMYDNGGDYSRGVSSVMDYALNVNRPIAISNDRMFRHIYDDRICAYKRPIRDIIDDPSVMEYIHSISKKWDSDELRKTIIRRLQLES